MIVRVERVERVEEVMGRLLPRKARKNTEALESPRHLSAFTIFSVLLCFLW